jgi:hypothetical protein
MITVYMVTMHVTQGERQHMHKAATVVSENSLVKQHDVEDSLHPAANSTGTQTNSLLTWARTVST